MLCWQFTSRQVDERRVTCSDKPQLTSIIMSGDRRVGKLTSRQVISIDKPQLTTVIKPQLTSVIKPQLTSVIKLQLTSVTNKQLTILPLSSCFVKIIRCLKIKER